MTTKVYVETDPEGTGQFVRLKRSRTTLKRSYTDQHEQHHHHRRHHHHHNKDSSSRRRDCGSYTYCHRHHDCIHVSIHDWNDLALTARTLRSENRDIRDALKSASREAKQLRASVRDLTSRASQLAGENALLQDSLDEATARADRYRRAAEGLERENRQLRRGCKDGVDEQVESLRRLAASWRNRFECAQRTIEDRNAVVEEQADKIVMLERTLRRHGIAICR